MKEYIAGIFCDLTITSDCVNHELLLPKLRFYGVRGVIVEWLKLCLSNRKQRVDLEVTKHTVTLLVGKLLSVAFRRVLYWVGPLLFYIHVFPKIINKLSHIVLFADDTNIPITFTNYFNLNQKLNYILHHTPNGSKQISWYQKQIKHVQSNLYLLKL
jgi:hypothetical protein